MRHHAFVIEASSQEGIATAHAWVEKELHISIKANPDVVVVQYGLFSIEDARRVSQLAAGAPFAGTHKVIIIAADRAYHETQNALLKLFEEPPAGVHFFLILPTLGNVLPTLLSRVSVLTPTTSQTATLPETVKEFIHGGKEKRSAIIKKLSSGKDEDARRENREEALQLVNGIEVVAYTAMRTKAQKTLVALLSDIAVLRGYLYDRSAPLRMILEHLSIVLPKDLL
jgi:hypothetical protein